MTETLRFPWGSDGDGPRREVAPSVFRPRKGGTSVGRLRSHASRPPARPANERRRPGVSSSLSAASVPAVTAPARGTVRTAQASREAARDRTPGRVVQGPQREVHEPDYLVLLAAVALSAIGILMVYSSLGVDTVKDGGAWDGDILGAVATQLTWAIVGAIVLLVVMRLDYRWWRKVSVVGFVVAVAFLVLVVGPSVPPLIEPIEVNGAVRWLRIGGLPSFHPAEIAKLAMVIYLAHWLATRGPDIASFRRGFLPFVVVIGLLGGLVAKEPDLGTTGVIALTGMAMFFVAGGRVLHVLPLVPLALAGVAVQFALNPYQHERWEVFLDPFRKDCGAACFQTLHGIYALALGGIFGQGLGQTRGPGELALPAAENDFIFAVVGQEFGLVGSLLVVGLFLLLAWRGIRIAMRAPDTFGGLMALGITAWLGLQAFINIGVVVQLVPLTGMPLPFLSDGGTSLVVALAAVGILLSISRETVSRGASPHEDPDRSRGHRRPHLPGLGRPLPAEDASA
jgi:cell division protein FtsW